VPELPFEISVEEVSVLLAEPGAPRLVDCREEDEWQICKIEGAELAPLSRFGEEAKARFADTNQHIIIYCHHGMRSQRAANFLRASGFAKAQSMRGGIESWADLIDPEIARY